MHERLATSDRGIVMLREMMMRELDKVEKGFDPLGVIRDPAENTVIDTKLAQSLQGPEFRRNLRAAAAGG
jgi:5,5'-dehydrodivanillate O-demethylase